MVNFSSALSFRKSGDVEVEGSGVTSVCVADNASGVCVSPDIVAGDLGTDSGVYAFGAISIIGDSRAGFVSVLSENNDAADSSSKVVFRLDSLNSFYDSILNLSEADADDMEKVHSLFMQQLYSREFFDVFDKILKVEDSSPFVVDALDAFKVVYDMIVFYAKKEGLSFFDAFMALYDESFDGGNDLLIKLKSAKLAAIECMEDYLSSHDDSFIQSLFDKETELLSGLQFSDEFVDKLKDPLTKSVVVSFDFNSTFTVHESFASVDLIAKMQREMYSFARGFRRAYPDKELIMAVNTGRPGHYAWGVVESSFVPIAEVRKVAVADSGGVILQDGLVSGKMEVAVDNPDLWKQELSFLKQFILDRVSGSVVVEPKESMLSIKIANQSGEFYLRSVDGEMVTDEWILNQVREYFLEKKDQLDDSDEFVARRLEMIGLMFDDALLQSKYNPTAGYVDICHKELNKFGTLSGYVRRTYGLDSDEILYVQIGDSSTDILPTEKTGAGESNDGADAAYIVAVADCNAALRAATEKSGDKGLFTKNPSILGAISMMKGLKATLT